MTSTVIVDSGPLIAAMNRSDPQNRPCIEILRNPAFHLVIPALCVAEVAYLIQKRQGTSAEVLFLQSLTNFDVQAPQPDDWPRIAELVKRYDDFPLGATDASVVALAERLRTNLVLTLDHRHFTVIKPRHSRNFRLLP